MGTRAGPRLTDGARDGVFHGTAEYIAQEEMDRPSGFWWSPDGARIACTEVDETAIPVYPIVHQGTPAWEVESSRYPFAGGPNARVRLGVLPSGGGHPVWIPLASRDDDVYLARVRWDEDGTLLVQVESRDQKSLKVLRADPGTGAMQRQLYRVWLEGGRVERVTAEPGWHTVTFARDGLLFVDLHDSAAAPPRAVLKDGAGRQVRVLDANADPEPKALGLRPPEFVTLKAKDGSVLHGAIYRPRPMTAGRKYPAIVRVYGGPTAQSVKDAWEGTCELRAPYPRRHRYVVVRPDNRRTPRRGKAFETALAKRLGSVEVEDQIAGARYLAGLPYVDGKRLGIYGWSYGGYMAARCLLKAPDLFKVAVAGAPVAEWDGYDTHYTERYMGKPQENLEGYRESSLLPLASRLDRRLLIVHGMIDENVHFRHTARLMNALNSAQKRYDLLIFPDERHLPRGEDDRRTMEARLVEFFDRALK